ncbi:chromate resistance protein [Myxococcus sp. AB036A]|uniref:chromate resistance protein n=1 Tax=Myxococcus sp. AB036A TaxID=2562793 RepID=UPI0011467BFE|nr:chromate resistance protein [Myxococcus sp. AB036A]
MCTYVDLKDSKLGRIKPAGIERLLAGITLNSRANEKRLARASTVLDLYAVFTKKPVR